MPLTSQPVGRRERNIQQKLERITAAARELFAQRGVDEVTAQEIADKADIGAGTLFLYAKNKGELLLQVDDDGKGFDTSKKRSGIGITNMITRTESLKGTLSIVSSPGLGCQLTVSLPLYQE